MGERKMERDIKSLKEEIEEGKIRFKMEKEKREKLEKKVQDMEEEMEMMRGRMKSMKEELGELEERFQKFNEKESRKSRGQRYEGKKRKRTKGEEESDIEDLKRNKRNEFEEEGKEKKRSKVWERGIILHMLNNWEEEETLEEWLEKMLIGKEWEIERTSNRDIYKVIFRSIEEYERNWSRRKELGRGGKVKLEQWMNMEERKAKGLIIRERERRREDEEKGEEVEDSEIVVEVNGDRYWWDSEKDRVVKMDRKYGQRNKWERERGRREEEE